MSRNPFHHGPPVTEPHFTDRDTELRDQELIEHDQHTGVWTVSCGLGC